MTEVARYSDFFDVRLEQFEGPIDLLLHLVKKEELPIEKLSLAQVTEQYLRCIKDSYRLDIELAGEYLVIAATLVAIKAKVILNEAVEFPAELDSGSGEDPAEELLRQLKRLEEARAVAKSLSALPVMGIDVFSTLRTKPELPTTDLPLADHSVLSLAKAFRKIIDRLGQDAPQMSFEIDKVSIVERMISLIDHLKHNGNRSSLWSIVGGDKKAGRLANRMTVVATFVALLELCRRSAIELSQSEDGSDILVYLPNQNAEVDVKFVEQAAN